MQYSNGRQGMVSSLQLRSVKSYISPHPDLGFIDPPAIRIENTFLPVEESTRFLGLWWDLRLSFKKHISVLKTQCREALNLIRVVAHLKWGRDRDTLLMLYRAIWCWTTVALCMAQHRIPIYDNWAAFTTLDWDWYWKHSVPAQSLASTHRPMKLLWRNVCWSYPCITIWKLVPALTTQHIMPFMNLNEPLEIWIPHPPSTKSHILSRGPPTACHHCGQTLTIEHMLLECAVLQECRDEYYTVDSLNALFETIPETCIVEFLREAGFFYLIWCNLSTSTSSETWTIWSDLSNLFREWKQLWDTFTCVGRLICPEGRVSSLNKSNPIQSMPSLWIYDPVF